MAATIDPRDAFAEEFFRPPHLARMLECAGQYTGRLCRADRDLILDLALENFWEMRESIHTSNDVLRMWDRALARAALTRPRWQVAVFSVPGAFSHWEWLAPKRLKRRS